MNYADLEDKAITRASVLSQRITEGGFNRREYNERAVPLLESIVRTELRALEEHGLEPVASPDVAPILEKVRSAHAQMLTARGQNLHPSEYPKIAQRLYDKLIRDVEKRWQDRFNKTVAEISRRLERQRANAAIPNADRLAAESLELQRQAVLLASVDARGAESRLADLAQRRRPYNYNEVLVLAGKTETGRATLEVIERLTPRHLADGEGVALLEWLERFVAHQPGDLTFSYRNAEGRPTEATFNIGECFNEKVAPEVEPVPTVLDTSRIPLERQAQHERDLAEQEAKPVARRPKSRAEEDEEVTIGGGS